MKVTNSTTPTSQCSGHTVWCRRNEILQVRKVLSLGDESEQMADEIKLIPKAERNELMKQASFNIQVPPEGRG